MVPGLFGFQSQALPYLIHSLIPEGSRLSAGLSPFLPLVCLLLRFVVLLLAMPSTTLPYIQPFAEFYFVLSDRLLAVQLSPAHTAMDSSHSEENSPTCIASCSRILRMALAKRVRIHHRCPG